MSPPIKSSSKLGAGVGFTGGAIENFKKSLMVTSSYFTHPTTMYSKACTVPGFDIVATSPRRSRRSLAPPEGGGAGFAEFPAGGTTSNKSKIFWLWKEENYLLILTFTQSFSDQYTTCTYTNISPHFLLKKRSYTDLCIVDIFGFYWCCTFTIRNISFIK